jgi:hypothetical protein
MMADKAQQARQGVMIDTPLGIDGDPLGTVNAAGLKG